MIRYVLEKTALALYGRIARYSSGTGIERSPLLRLLHRRIIARLKPECLPVDGHLIYLDATDAMGLTFRKEAPPSLRYLKTVVHRGDVVADVGAHIGYYTLSLARLVGEQGHVFAFEPTPATAALLKKNVAVNCIDKLR
jgi:hypothetical protein